MSGLVGQAVFPAGPVLRDEASGIPQRGVYAGVGGVLAVVEAFGLDAEQDFDAVPRTLGNIGGGDSCVEPEGHCRMAQVVGAFSVASCSISAAIPELTGGRPTSRG